MQRYSVLAAVSVPVSPDINSLWFVSGVSNLLDLYYMQNTTVSQYS